MQIYC